MGKVPATLMALLSLAPAGAFAADQSDMMKKIDDLTQQLTILKQQLGDMQTQEAAKAARLDKVEQKADAASEKGSDTWPSWIELGGDFQSRFDSLQGNSAGAVVFNPNSGMAPVPGTTYKNSSLLSDRFGLNLKIQATDDVQVKARLLMYKLWGQETAGPVTGANAFFADKQSIFDGNLGHTPSSENLLVDQAYATWSNIGGNPLWFSIGRRPSTGGVPTNLRENREKSGTAGTPGMMIDYAFDGATFGIAPSIDALPGFYAKLCYGKGYDSGYNSTSNTMKDVNFIGLNVTPYETDNFRAELQYSRAMGIFAFPEGTSFAVPFMNTSFPNVNLGDIDQFGLNLTGRIDNVGPGNLNLFFSPAFSKTHPNGNTFGPGYGLMWDVMSGESAKSGHAIYLGARYDVTSTGTKLGVEYNHGSENWITFTPASDDLVTSKLGTRGSVYEAYLIQEFRGAAVAKMGKAFFRVGYQYYDFDYTGSNNWVGAPTKISDLASTPYMPLMFVPLKNAKDFYATFEVQF
jgi:hypothetical protein